MSGSGVPTSNTVPGSEQNFHPNDARNHFETNNLAKNGGMHGNISPMNTARSPQNPYGVHNQAMKTASNTSQAIAGMYMFLR